MNSEELVELFKEDCIKSYNVQNSKFPVEEFEETSYEIIDGPEDFPLENFELHKDASETNHDSYGNEDSTLKVIYKLKSEDRYVMLYGRRQSYNGTDIDGIKEVKPTIKQITIFE